MKKNVISILMIFVLLFGTVAPSFEKVSFANKSNENNIVYTDKKINSDAKKSLTDSSKHNENDIEKTKKEVDIKTGIKANNTKSKEGKKTDSISEKTLEKNKSENKKIEKDKKSDTERNKSKEQTFITEVRDIMRTPKEVDATIVEFKIVRDNNENPTGTFNFYEAFKIKIKWDASKHGKTLKKGDFFKIKIPEEFRLAHKIEFDLKTEDGKVLGHLVATPNTNGGADVVVTFNEYVETHENIKGEFSFDSAFNVSKYIKKSDGSYTISYTFDGKTYNHNIKPKPNVSNNEVFVKWANKTQDGLNEAEWVLRLNFKKGIFANVVISDELTSETGVLPLNIKYKPDTFRLKQVEFNSTGDDISGDKYKSIKYEELKNYITFDKDMRKFTFRMSDFLKDKGYSTDGKLNATQWYLFYKSTYEKGLKLKNKAEFKSKEETIERSSYYQSAEGNGSGGGDLTNKIKIKKVDSDNTDKPLANAKFKIIKKGDTSKVWNIVTDAKGEAETERLSQGDYEIIETDAPLGYMRDDKPIPVKIIDGQATITTIKNKKTKIEVKVTKAWEDKNDQDGKRPTSVTIKLLADGVETGDKLTLTAVNGWKGSFDNLDEYKAGKKIQYSIEEEDVGNGYSGFIAQTSNTEFNVINKREPEKTFVEGTKTWNDKDNQDGKRPTEITINLLKNGTKIASKKVTKADGWKWKFENLDKYESGKEINYTIAEEKVEGYTTEVKGYDVKNSYTPGKTSLQVTKAWEDKNDQDGVRPNSVTIKLLADGVETGKKLVLTKANNWTGSFTDLDEYKAGKKIVYTIKEETVGNGYISVVTKTGENTFIVTNTREPEKTFVEGTKTWNDKDNQDGKRPTEITINLLKNGTKIASKKVTKADGWKWKFENLDKYESGKEINYTIAEEKVEGYTTEVKGYDVNNSYTPGKTSLQVTKAWEDKNDQDGVRPNSVTIKLLADGVETGKKLVLTKANNWTGSFTDLDEYKDGKKIVYTIKEEPVGNGYISVVTKTGENTFIVTNTREPEKTFVEGTKTWNDKDNQDGKRPTEITINLLKNGTKIASKKVTKADGWKWKFENLDKYESGKEINYTIAEEKVEGYTTEVKGYDVNNSYTPGKTSLQVTKAWEDKNDQDGVRPNSVTIKLLADGVETGKKLVLTKANNWTGSFTDLDEYKAGKKIVYTIKEEPVGNGYKSVITGNEKEGFVVTNVRTPEQRIPKTGAGSNSALYTVLLGLSGTVIFSVFRRKRKENL
ncbi:Cna B-type domain-containing protein [Parvimonas micra]|uniref:Cna B-type domain-containing protein n=2 Tax=Parvimonas TaxID=543311 RepID=UPI001F429ED4|nr:Cna B-type domain-containing protein [Parvimonas micra]